MLDKNYDAAAVEPRIYAAWEKAGAFKAGAGARGGAPYCIVIPPPNVTGSLHLGHALDNTLQDILVRFQRMRGRDVLWQPGTDHAGIATQMVVERQMMERQEPNRRAIGREKFLEKVWKWKAESGGQIINQLKRLGASADWSRERFTMGERGAPDDQMVQAVTKAFVDLYNTVGPDGRRLIYKDKRLVNWDPALQTAISDLEVDQVEVKGKLWHFRYPIEGKTFDPADRSTFITVATTRPETMLGDTGVAVHPDDERYKDLVGKYAILPLVGRRLRIVADEYADPETGSGAVKITPAHDFNDFEVGKRQGLQMVSIFDREAKVALAGNADFLADIGHGKDLVTSGPEPTPIVVDDNVLVDLMDGRERFASNKKVLGAREQIIAMLEARGLVEKVEDHVHSVPHGDRSAVPIEPYLTDQWYVNATKMAEPAIAAVREGKTLFVPKNWETTYFNWMENIQPWCISRQLWWGHQIPAWYGPKFHPPGELHPTEIGALSDPEVFVAATQAEAMRLAERHYGRNVRIVKPPRSDFELGQAAAPDDEPIPMWQRAVPMWRDEDVLDTWFSSALWPFSTLGWPEETPELKRYYPTATLVTGFDIIFFWVARMMMMGLHFMAKERPDAPPEQWVPFRDVYIHALILDEKGQKMSKSKGNVIDPLGLIDQYGADALRFTLASLAGQGRNIRMSGARVEGYRNFVTKLWNAAKFAEHYDCRRVEKRRGAAEPLPGSENDFDPSSAKDTLNRWIATETTRTVAAVTAAIEAYKFNEAAAALYRFVWNSFCDWYLELTKPVLNGGDGPAKDETRATVAFVLDRIVALLHPFMPFITEALWEERGGAGLLALGAWPVEEFEDPAAADEINWLIELITAIRSVRSEMNVPAAAMVPLSVSGATPATAARLATHDIAIRRLARLETISAAERPEKGAVQIVVGEAVYALPLAGVIDFAAERARLRRELDKTAKEIAKIDAKLGNAQFMAKAPEDVVEEQRERLAEAAALKAKTEAALAQLSA